MDHEDLGHWLTDWLVLSGTCLILFFCIVLAADDGMLVQHFG